MILVRKIAAGSYELVNGNMRLRAMIQVNGHARVRDVETGETLTVHEVGGCLLALTDDSLKAVEAAAAAAINSAGKSES